MACSRRVVRSSFLSPSTLNCSLTVEALESRTVPNATIGAWSPAEPVTSSLLPDAIVSDGNLLRASGGEGARQEQAPTVSIGLAPTMQIDLVMAGPPTYFGSPLSVGSSSGPKSESRGGTDLGVIPSSTFLLLAAGPIGGPGITFQTAK